MANVLQVVLRMRRLGQILKIRMDAKFLDRSYMGHTIQLFSTMSGILNFSTEVCWGLIKS